MKVICVANQKGGVGKTTTAAALATGLRKRGHNPLVIDLDPQGNLSCYASQELAGRVVGAKQLMSKEAAWAEAVVSTDMFDVVAPGRNLESMEAEAASESWLLMEAIESLGDDAPWDYAIVDTRPSLGALTRNGLYASDYIVIPAVAAEWSGEGMSLLLGKLEAIARHSSDVSFKVAGLLITQYRSQTRQQAFWRESLAEFAESRSIPVLGTIRLGIKVDEAQTKHLPLSEHAPNEGVTADYENFVDEFLRQVEGGSR